MPYGALERMLRTERLRQRAAAGGGFSTPGMCLSPVADDAMPLLATNMRGNFRETRRDIKGQAPFGFSYCQVGREDPLLSELHRTLFELSARANWPNRCSSVAEAVERLRTSGVEPKSLVVSESQVANFMGPGFDLNAARSAMGIQGFVTVVDDMQVLLSGLPEGFALVAAAPSILGLYTRVGDHVGILLQRVNRSIMVVQPHVA